MINVLTWNVAMRYQAVHELLAMDADGALFPRTGQRYRSMAAIPKLADYGARSKLTWGFVSLEDGESPSQVPYAAGKSPRPRTSHLSSQPCRSLSLKLWCNESCFLPGRWPPRSSK